MKASIEESDRSVSLVLNVTVPKDELPPNESLAVENRIREYIDDEYDIWYNSCRVVVQDDGEDYDGVSKRFRVAVVD